VSIRIKHWALATWVVKCMHPCWSSDIEHLDHKVHVCWSSATLIAKHKHQIWLQSMSIRFDHLALATSIVKCVHQCWSSGIDYVGYKVHA
jgi:hypothetical protein